MEVGPDGRSPYCNQCEHFACPGRGFSGHRPAISYLYAMSKKLYIGNLPYTTTTEELQQTFAQAGTVEEAIVMSDKITGRSRGFGFVTMADDAGAASAIEMFNGKDFGGRNLVVNEE